MGTGLVDDAGGGELLRFGVFHIAQAEQEAFLLAGGQGDLQPQGGHGGPAGGFAVIGGAVLHRHRFAPAPEPAQEGVPVRVEPGHGGVDGVEGVVVPALPVLGLVVDGAALDLYLTDVPVPLIVGGIVHRVPEAPLHGAVDCETLDFLIIIAQGQLLQLAGAAHGHQAGELGRNTLLLPLEDGVSKAVAAAIAVQRGLGRQEGRAPGHVPVADVEAAAPLIVGHVVVAEAGDAPELGVPIEGVAAAGVGDQGEEALVAQVVDPGQGRIGTGDDIFPGLVVKIAVSHNKPHFL